MTYDPRWVSVLQADFMHRAFIAGILISIAAGAVGYFIISRKSTFATHALAHIGLPGATGAVLIGLPATWGMGLFALSGALIIGYLGKKASEREIATGTVLAFATGLGLYFSRLSSGASSQMQSILFGSILTMTYEQLLTFAIFDAALILILVAIFRPLLFSSLDEDVARAKGIPVTLLSIIFMAMLAGVITVAVPAVGTLLVFALVITPADTATMLTRSPGAAIIVTTIICFISICGGLLISIIFPMPPSFAIVSFSTGIWLVAKAIQVIRR